MGENPSRLAVLFSSGLLAVGLSCGPSAPAPPAQAIAGGLGTLSVSGSGRESYSLRDSAGNHITSVSTGTKKELAAGDYSIALGNVAKVQVRAGEVTSFAIGTLAVSGTGKEGYSLRDSAGTHVTTVQSSTEKELVPGDYSVALGNVAKVVVKGDEVTPFALGTLAVSGTGKEGYSLRDSAGTHVTTVQSSTEKELVPGDYFVALGNIAQVVVKGGEQTPFALGTLAVSGTGKEGYSLRDSAGSHVTTVQSSTEKELVPGDYFVALGNVAKVVVNGGEQTSFALGVLVAGASGGSGIGLSDEGGAHVTTLSAGEPKELVPGGYTLRIGEEDVPVHVSAGETATHQP